MKLPGSNCGAGGGIAAGSGSSPARRCASLWAAAAPSAARRDADGYLVVAAAFAGEYAGGVVVDVGVGVRLGSLENGGVVHGPLGRITLGPGSPRAAAAVLIGAEPRAGRLAGDDSSARLDLQRARACDRLRAAGRHAAVPADPVFRATLGDVDIHRKVGAIDHADVIEVQVVPGVQVVPWIMVFLYLGAFVVPGPLAIVTGYGLLVFLRKYREQILGLWLLSLAAFYLLWFGNTAAGQNYYNLPALAPLCALFGIGANAALGWIKIVRWRFAASVVTAAVVMISAVPALIYLFKQDRPILEAARWTRAHTGSNETIIFCPNHRWDMIDYPFNAVLTYYSDRPTFVWTRNTPDQYRQAALQRASYAIVTLPQPPAGGILGVVNRFRRAYDRQPESVDWLESAGFEKVAVEEGFVAYRRK